MSPVYPKSAEGRLAMALEVHRDGFITDDQLQRIVGEVDPEPTPEMLALIKDADTPTAEEAAEAEIDRGLSERMAEQFKKNIGSW